MNSQELIPLKQGNSWKYSAVKTVNGNTEETDTVISVVGQPVVYNNKQWFHLNELGDEYIVRNDENGQYELDTLNTNENSDFAEVLMFKNPKGLKENSYFAYDIIKVTVDADTHLIKTSIGDFTCIKYTLIPQEAGDGEVIEFYIAPGVGVIFHKWITAEWIKTRLLVEYTLK